MSNTTTNEFDKYANTYFDDIDGHIETLQNELDITEKESEHADALYDRIVYLKERHAIGDLWVDNDITASPGAWKSLATYTDAEARAQYKIWDE